MFVTFTELKGPFLECARFQALLFSGFQAILMAIGKPLALSEEKQLTLFAYSVPKVFVNQN